MIPDYKLFQGAVLAHIIDEAKRPLTISELTEAGRLHSYIIDHRIGVHIKHSTARLSPWQFTFSAGSHDALSQLRAGALEVYIVLACWLDGLVCLSFNEWSTLLGEASTATGWIRTARQKRGWYSVNGSSSALPHKKPHGIAPLLESLRA